MTGAYLEALAAIDAGDLARLRAVLAAHPGVVHETEDTVQGRYRGYFAHATLLHHVAGNPIRGPLPPNIVEAARILIDAGADFRAPVGADRRGDLVGLVASGALMAESGLYRPMIDLLLEKGYRFDDDRGVLSVCLFHTVECQRQREVGEYLAARGAKIDLVFAAALGRTDLVAGFFPDGALTDAGYGPFRDDFAERRARGAPALLQEALLWACMNGRPATAAQLLDHGTPLDGGSLVAGMTLTALHGAAWAGWAETVEWLLDRGADPTILDPRWNNTALALAAWCRKDTVVAVLRARCAGRLSLEDTVSVGDLPEVAAALAGRDVNEPPPGTVNLPGVLLRDAAVYGRTEIVRWLLERGADRSLANPEGKTARDLALERGFTEVAALLS